LTPPAPSHFARAGFDTEFEFFVGSLDHQCHRFACFTKGKGTAEDIGASNGRIVEFNDNIASFYPSEFCRRTSLEAINLESFD
jgi:hypothetical protein